MPPRSSARPPRRPRPRATAAAVMSALAALAALALPGPAAALQVVQNIAYNQPNLSPWAQGSAFTLDWSRSFGGALDFRVPTVDMSLSGLLAGFLDLPKIGFVEASVEGRAGAWVDVGFYVSGGRLSLKYPGQGRLDFGAVGPGRAGTLQTAFVPGLTREIASNSTKVSLLFGRGYEPEPSLPGFAWDRYKAPAFATSFPTASAWADIRYEARADLGVTAGVARAFGVCVLCKRFSAGVSAADTIPLLAIDQTGVSVLGKQAVPLFGQDFSLGVVSARLDYPNLRVQGGLQADGVTLGGRDARAVLQFNAPLEQLVPFVGPLLSPKVGPFEITLLSIAGGPSLGLYQDFEVAVDPKVRLDFGTLVEFRRNGQRSIGRSITLDLGEDIEWTPVMNALGTVRVQPTWLLDGTVRNETGLALGAQLAVDALKLKLPPLPTMGPVKIVRVEEPDLVSIPLYTPDPFPIARTVVPGAPVDVPVRASFGDRVSLQPQFLGARPLGDPGLVDGPWQLRFAVDGVAFDTEVRATALGLGEDGLPADFALFPIDVEPGWATFGAVTDVILQTAAPLRLPMNLEGPGFEDYAGLTLDLGSLFCWLCTDRSAQLVDQGNFIADGGERLYMNRLHEFGTDLGVARALPGSGAWSASEVALATSVVAVPEPGTWALMAGGLLAVAGAARRRR